MSKSVETKKLSPCDYCINPKHDGVPDSNGNTCHDKMCYWYSGFKPAPNTPDSVLFDVEEAQDNEGWE